MLYLGIDSSTQGVKGIVIDPAAGRIVAEAAVNYGKDLKRYNAPNGYVENADPAVKEANPLMWVDGLELLLQRLVDSGVPMERISAISGAGQQHGSVYLRAGSADIFSKLVPEKSLSEQISGTLARELSPIWMDRSTVEECRELTGRFGPAIQQLTGSRATERFTGPQIRRFWKNHPEAYNNTAQIHLVSSFICALLTGGRAAVDTGDGAGMNLLNLKTLEFDPEISEFTAPGLPEKLPELLPGNQIAGKLPEYFAKYGLRAGIPVIVFSGDNPSSLIGSGCSQPGVVGISLGTSDTLFAPMRDFELDPAGYGHIMGNPAGGFMSLICFSNGSLARDAMRESLALSWNAFDAVAAAAPAAAGNLMLPYYQLESTPLVLKPHVEYNFDIKHVEPGVAARALLESQALSMKLHTAYLKDPVRKIRLSGGASACKAFRQILADVFQVELEIISVSDSSGLGAALRAAAGDGWQLEELYRKFCAAQAVILPQPENRSKYEKMLQQYADMEKAFSASEG